MLQLALRVAFSFGLMASSFSAPSQAAESPSSFHLARAGQANTETSGSVVRNHDGDTITVRLDSGKVENVRLLGIDTAEMAQGIWGAKARDYLKVMVGGKRVRLVFDVQQRDKYGRLLAYVYLMDGTFVNLALVKQGYAMILTYPPNVAHTAELQAAQTEARNRGLNIWGTNGLKETPHDFRHKGEGARTYSRGQGMSVSSPSRPQARSAAPAATTSAGRVSLNTRSGKYHEPGCQYYGCANCREVSSADARARGVPGKCCH